MVQITGHCPKLFRRRGTHIKGLKVISLNIGTGRRDGKDLIQPEEWREMRSKQPESSLSHNSPTLPP